MRVRACVCIYMYMYIYIYTYTLTILSDPCAARPDTSTLVVQNSAEEEEDMQDMSAGHSLLVASGTPFPLDLNESRTKVVESGDTAVPIRPIFPPNLSFSFPLPLLLLLAAFLDTNSGRRVTARSGDDTGKRGIARTTL